MLFFCKTDGSDEFLTQAMENVTPQRRAKALRLPTRRARANSLVAELLAKYALRQYGLSQDDFYFDRKGAPCVRQDAAFLSLSHSGEYVACAVSANRIGVDIQKVKPVSPRVIKRVCSREEVEALDPENTSAAFTRIWSLKEAWRKANPQATTIDMLQSSFIVLQNGTIIGPPGFTYTLSDELEGYALAVCERKQW